MSFPPLDFTGPDDAPSGDGEDASARKAFDRQSPFYPHTPASLSDLMCRNTQGGQAGNGEQGTSHEPLKQSDWPFTPPDSDFEPSAPYNLVISPSPVLWAEELQVFNDQPGRLSVWRELALRSRQRGSALLGGRDWIGPVLIPSGVVGLLVEKQKLKAPVRWMAMPSQALSRFISMLHAWQTERLIYDFSGLAGELVMNSTADMALTPQLFSSVPSHAIYIDFESMNFRQKGRMAGVFVGLNADDTGQLELVMIEDCLDQVKVHSIALKGQSMDEAIHDMLNQARRVPNPEKLSQAMDFVDNRLQILLSAVMMVCSSHHGARHIEDGVSCRSGHGRWARWRISTPFTDTISKAYARAIRLDLNNAPVLVAEWVEPPQGSLANLRCSIGTRQEWGNVPGMSAEYRAAGGASCELNGFADRPSAEG